MTQQVTGSRRVDVCVVGAASTGLNVAYQFAKRGHSVVVVERRDAGDAGPTWVNGVVPWQFERAELDVPVEPELYLKPQVNHMVGPSGAPAFQLRPGPIWRVSMPKLIARLRSLAVDNGAVLLDRATIVGIEHQLGRPTSVTVERDGADITIKASLFVDCSGRVAVLRHAVSHFDEWCRDLGPDELCVAGDYHHAIADRAGAQAFLDAIGAQPGDHINRVGRNGGWSTESYRLAPDFSSLDLLIGAVAAEAPGPLPSLVDSVLAEQPWIGERTGGGSGFIPLRRPYGRLTAPGVALVGDAACQVFCAHGSGVGMGLMAGTMLAASVSDGVVSGSADIGSPDALWRYQHRFWRTYGPRLVSYDLFRRLSTGLDTDGVERLLSAGVMTASSTSAAMDQRWEIPAPAELASQAQRLRRDRRLTAFVAPALARITAAQRLAALAPTRPSLSALRRWERSIDRLVAQQDAARFQG